MASRALLALALAAVLILVGGFGVPAQERDSLTQRFGTQRLLLTAEEAERLRAIFVERTAATTRTEPDSQNHVAPAEPAIMVTDEPGTESDEPPPPPDPVKLDALVYIGPDTWSFWLDGNRFTPRRTPVGFTVERVTGKAVRLRWRPHDQRTYVFTLKPRQRFDPATRQVLDNASLTGEDGVPADG